MKNTWYHLMSKRALVLSLVGALLCTVLFTSGMANAQSIAHQQSQAVVTHQHSTSDAVHPDGSNGQQLALWVGSGLGIESVVVNGSNQYGNGATNCYPDYSTDPMPLNQWNYFPGYWWVGQVGLQYFSGPGCTGTPLSSDLLYVPVSQSKDYTCNAYFVGGNPIPGPC